MGARLKYVFAQNRPETAKNRAATRPTEEGVELQLDSPHTSLSLKHTSPPCTTTFTSGPGKCTFSEMYILGKCTFRKNVHFQEKCTFWENVHFREMNILGKCTFQCAVECTFWKIARGQSFSPPLEDVTHAKMYIPERNVHFGEMYIPASWRNVHSGEDTQF